VPWKPLGRRRGEKNTYPMLQARRNGLNGALNTHTRLGKKNGDDGLREKEEEMNF
jgi:hypothetical protein